VNVLIDTGPLVAFFNVNDNWHDRVIEFFGQFTGTLVITAPVLVECFYHLKDAGLRNELLADVTNQNIYRLEPITAGDLQRIKQLAAKYSDVLPDFADLSLIAVSERLNIARICTLDDEFRTVFRRLRNKLFDCIDL
jgi:uncharacterized protein